VLDIGYSFRMGSSYGGQVPQVLGTNAVGSSPSRTCAPYSRSSHNGESRACILSPEKWLAFRRWSANLFNSSMRRKGVYMQDRSMRELCRVIAGMRQPQDVQAFFRALLTPPERARIALRWRLVCLLEAGVKQRTIVKRLRVSLCKITRGSRELKHGPACFRASVKKSVRRGG